MPVLARRAGANGRHGRLGYLPNRLTARLNPV